MASAAAYDWVTFLSDYGHDDVFVGVCKGVIDEVVEVATTELYLPRVHATFRGRDIYAPVAAHLAAGRPLADVSPAVAAADLVRIKAHLPVVDDDHVHAEIHSVDHFGNAS